MAYVQIVGGHLWPAVQAEYSGPEHNCGVVGKDR